MTGDVRPEEMCEQALREQIALRLCNWYQFPAYEMAHTKGWAPELLAKADQLIGMVRESDVAAAAVAGDTPAIPAHLFDQADILAKVGAVSREVLYGLVAATWEAAHGAVRDD